MKEDTAKSDNQPSASSSSGTGGGGNNSRGGNVESQSQEDRLKQLSEIYRRAEHSGLSTSHEQLRAMFPDAGDESLAVSADHAADIMEATEGTSKV